MSYGLSIGHFYSDPDDWEVYGALKTGGCLTVFQGTEHECRVQLTRNRDKLIEKLVAADREASS